MKNSSNRESHNAAPQSEPVKQTTERDTLGLVCNNLNQEINSKSQAVHGSPSHFSDNFETRGTKLEWEENILDIQLRESEASVEQLSSTSMFSVDHQRHEHSRSSSLSDVRPQPTEMESGSQDANDEFVIIRSEPKESIMQQQNGTMVARHVPSEDPSPSFDEAAATYVERLLAAIERLRGERDDLRRNVHFLEAEAKIAAQTLEARKADVCNPSGAVTPETLSEGVRSSSVDVMASEKLESRKSPSFRKMELAASASAIVIGHIQQEADVVTDRLSVVVENLRRQLEEKEQQVDAMAISLEAANCCVGDVTAKQDDLQSQVSSLQSKNNDHHQEIDRLKNAHQETQDTLTCTITSLEEVTASLKQVESERDTLNLHITNLQIDLLRAQQTANEAETLYNDLRYRQLSSVPSDKVVESLGMQINELEERVLRRTEQIGIHQHDIKRLETNLRLQEERVGEMTAELETLSTQKDAMVEDCADAREARDEAIRKAEEMEVEVEGLEARAEGLEGKLEKVERERDDEVRTLVGIVFDLASRSREAKNIAKAKTTMAVEDKTSTDTIRHLTLALATSQVKLKRTVHSIREAEATSSLQPDGAVEKGPSAQDPMELIDLKNRLDRTSNELEQVKRLHADVEASHRGALDEAACFKQELADQIRAAADRDEESEIKLGKLRAEHADEIGHLRKQLDTLSEEIKGSNDSRTKLESLRESAVEELARTEKEHEIRLTRATERLREVILHLESEAARRTDQLVSLQAQLDTSSREVSQITRKLEEEAKSRAAERERYVNELASAVEQCSRAETNQTDLRQELNDGRRKLEETRIAFESLQEEKTNQQMEMTNLAAEIQRSISLNRFLESQARDNERAITSLKETLECTRVDLANSEKSGKAAEINLSLKTAQHERAMSNLLRELTELRSKPALEGSMAKLEERNAELEELLKSKCAEIEENDDRFIEMLKEKKKLLTKIDTLSRKVQNLQSKPTACPPASKSASETAISSSKGPPSSTPTPSVPIRSRSNTVATHPFPTHPLNDNATPIRAIPGSRAVSGPSSLAPLKIRTIETPESFPSHTTPDPLLSASLRRKRKVPDDFETCDGVPPKGFTTECLPSDDIENSTPRLRRALQSVPGFTPVRTRIPTPKKETAKSITDVTNKARSTPLTAPQFAQPTKRSWLGKIRGISSQSTSRAPLRD